MMQQNKMVPEDLVQEILWRLPVKSLLRFRCASKSWCSSISDPRFVRSHRRLQSENNSRLLVFHHHGTKYSKSGLIENLRLKHPDLSNYFNYSIASICDGLVALKFFDSYRCYTIPKYSIVICNPCTGESRLLPTFDLGVAEDACAWYVRFGFGYDLSNDDYKVVVLSQYKKNIGKSGILFHVLSLKSDAHWRYIARMTCDQRLTLCEYGNLGVYLNGSLHWGTYRTTQTSQEVFNIVSFNLSDEKFTEFPGIDIQHYNDHCLHKISVYKGCICVNKYCISKIDGSVEYISLWIMKEYGDPASWTHQIFHIRSLYVPRNLIIPEFQTEFRIWFSRDNSNSGLKSDLVLHDLEGRQVKSIQVSRKLIVETFLFHETLVSPYPGRSIDQAECSDLEDFFSACDAYTSFVP